MILPPGVERCPACTRQKELRRGTPVSRGYDKRWFHYSRQFRARYPFCGQRVDGRFHTEHSLCARAGLRVLGQCVDHIVPIRNGGSIFDPSNHQTLCNRCNSVKG